MAKGPGASGKGADRLGTTTHQILQRDRNTHSGMFWVGQEHPSNGITNYGTQCIQPGIKSVATKTKQPQMAKPLQVPPLYGKSHAK